MILARTLTQEVRSEPPPNPLERIRPMFTTTRRLALALCVTLSCLFLAGTANAYPTSSTTTLTKTYRPLNLDLSTLQLDTVGCDGCPTSYTSGLELVDGTFSSLTLVFSGSWTPYVDPITRLVAYGLSPDMEGFAGYWVYQLSDATGAFNSEASNGQITISASVDAQLGTFTYAGGGSFVGLPVDGRDTPLDGDVFELFTTEVGPQLLITLLDQVGNFKVELKKQLLHVGPYVTVTIPCEDGDNDEDMCSNAPATYLTPSSEDEYCTTTELDFRLNGDCDPSSRTGCGGLTSMIATSIPEPGTVALFGLGLAGLGIRLRSRRKAPLA
jgi:hypothetical protein